MQQGDVLLQQGAQGADIEVTGGAVLLTTGFETAAFLSLFGGNRGAVEWWGNIIEAEPANKMDSATQNIIDGLPATSSNLRRIEAAVLKDLKWMIGERVASKIQAVATLPELNRVSLVITIEAHGNEESFEFVENWKSLI